MTFKKNRTKYSLKSTYKLVLYDHFDVCLIFLEQGLIKIANSIFHKKANGLPYKRCIRLSNVSIFQNILYHKRFSYNLQLRGKSDKIFKIFLNVVRSSSRAFRNQKLTTV